MSMNTDQLPTTLTPDELLALEGWPLGRSSTYDALKRGDIPSVRIGRRILIPRAALDRLLSGDSGGLEEGSPRKAS
jgi:excisionase family DNA binding protein